MNLSTGLLSHVNRQLKGTYSLFGEVAGNKNFFHKPMFKVNKSMLLGLPKILIVLDTKNGLNHLRQNKKSLNKLIVQVFLMVIGYGYSTP